MFKGHKSSPPKGQKQGLLPSHAALHQVALELHWTAEQRLQKSIHLRCTIMFLLSLIGYLPQYQLARPAHHLERRTQYLPKGCRRTCILYIQLWFISSSNDFLHHQDSLHLVIDCWGYLVGISCVHLLPQSLLVQHILSINLPIILTNNH